MLQMRGVGRARASADHACHTEHVVGNLEMKAQQARDGLAAAGYSRAAFNALHEAERELAASKGEEWAEPVDLAVVWDGGAPLPHVISSGRRTILICRAADRDPDWDGTRVRLVSPTDTEPVGHLEFTFEGCSATRFGGPNDEVLHGHPLSSRGLDGYGVHLVHNSRWIAEEEAINSVHPQHVGGWSERLSHYFFVFHDEMFEALARSVSVEEVQGTMSELLTSAASRIIHA